MSKTYTQEEVDAITALVRAEREWVDLTDDEIAKIVDDQTLDDCGYDIWCDGDAVARAVIAAFKEKNK